MAKNMSFFERHYALHKTFKFNGLTLKMLSALAFMFIFICILLFWLLLLLLLLLLFCCTELIMVTASVTKDIKKANTRNNLKTKKDFKALPKGAKGSPEPQWDESLFIKWLS